MAYSAHEGRIPGHRGTGVDEDEKFLSGVLETLGSNGVHVGQPEIVVTNEATDMEGESVVIHCRHGNLHFSVEQDRTFDGLTSLNAHFSFSDDETTKSGSELDLTIAGLIARWKSSAPAPCAVQRSFAPGQEDAYLDFRVDPVEPSGTSVLVSVWFQQDPNFEHSFAAMQPSDNDGSLEWMLSSSVADAIGLVPGPNHMRQTDEVVNLFLDFLGTASSDVARVRADN